MLDEYTLPQLFKEPQFHAFSNGTEAMTWLYNNCDQCKKGFHPKNGEYPNDRVMRAYCSSGKECKLKYFIDYGFVVGSIPDVVAELIGKGEQYGLAQSCRFFSDNDDDKYKAPKRPRPDPDNQMVMPFIIEEIGFEEVKQKQKELV